MRCLTQKFMFGTLCIIAIASYALYASSNWWHVQDLMKTATTSSIAISTEEGAQEIIEIPHAIARDANITITITNDADGNVKIIKIPSTKALETPSGETESSANISQIPPSATQEHEEKTPSSQERRPSETTTITTITTTTTTTTTTTETPKTSPKKTSSDRFEAVLKPSSREYLSPVNSFKDFISKDTLKQPGMRELVADVFRSGYGLTPYLTEDGKKGWMENGVVYRPIRQHLKLMSSHSNVRLEHPTDYEHSVPYDKKEFFRGGTIPSDEQLAKPKIILWYNRIGYVPAYMTPQPLRLCPDLPCRITGNRRLAANSSALVFDRTRITNFVPKRSPDQVYIFHDVETSPDLESKDKLTIAQAVWRTVFNWTMSPRMDADIQTFYGIIRKRPEPLEKNYTSLIAMKTKLVTSTISHCNTKGRREDYIRTLQRFIKVDVYGSCGQFRCPRGKDTECGRSISTQYKFYLGFENILCDGYLTEKLYRYMSLDVITIVRGGANYLLHLPPEIFINTADYKSPRHLAERLKYLDQHPAEYEAMLREKDKYMALYEAWYHANSNGDVSYTHYHYEAIPFCRICHRLWNVDSYAKTIPDIKAWFYNYTCIPPETFL